MNNNIDDDSGSEICHYYYYYWLKSPRGMFVYFSVPEILQKMLKSGGHIWFLGDRLLGNNSHKCHLSMLMC